MNTAQVIAANYHRNALTNIDRAVKALRDAADRIERDMGRKASNVPPEEIENHIRFAMLDVGRGANQAISELAAAIGAAKDMRIAQRMDTEGPTK